MICLQILAALFSNLSIALVDKRTSRLIKNRTEVMDCTCVKTFLCVVLGILFLFAGSHRINEAGLLLGLLAGLFHAASVVLIMHSLRSMPAVYVNLVMAAGIVLPSLFGWIILGQECTITKIGSLLLLVVALAMVLQFRPGEIGFLKLLIPLFFCYGLLMGVQGIYPSYCPGGSKLLFSVITYGASVLVLLTIRLGKEILEIRAVKQGRKDSGEENVQKQKLFKLGRQLLFLCLLSAAGNLVISVLLTELSSKLDAVVVFPTVHGTKLVAITLLSPFIWKEKLTRTQVIGCFMTILCICVLSV